MKKRFFNITILAVAALFCLSSVAGAEGRKGRFGLGLYAPGLFTGNEHIGAMISFGADAEYYFLERLSANFRIEEATDFSMGDAPHSVLTFVARARYVFDVGSSGRWSIYVEAGGGGALIGSDAGAGDIAIPGGGFWYQWDDKWSFGADASMHILVRDDTAFAFGITPVLRYRF